MGLHEDALKFSNLALFNDPQHVKSKFRKAKCLAYLFEFDESEAIFKEINSENELEFVNQLKDQMDGKYNEIAEN